MPPSDIYTLVSTQMRRFKDELYRLLQRGPTHAEHADVADTLNGETAAEITEDLLDIVRNHTDQIGVNVHHVTAGQANTPTKEEYDEDLAFIGGGLGTIPFSNFGGISSLKPPVLDRGYYDHLGSERSVDATSTIVEIDGEVYIAYNVGSVGRKLLRVTPPDQQLGAPAVTHLDAPTGLTRIEMNRTWYTVDGETYSKYPSSKTSIQGSKSIGVGVWGWFDFSFSVGRVSNRTALRFSSSKGGIFWYDISGGPRVRVDSHPYSISMNVLFDGLPTGFFIGPNNPFSGMTAQSYYTRTTVNVSKNTAKVTCILPFTVSAPNATPFQGTIEYVLEIDFNGDAASSYNPIVRGPNRSGSPKFSVRNGAVVCTNPGAWLIDNDDCWGAITYTRGSPSRAVHLTEDNVLYIYTQSIDGNVGNVYGTYNDGEYAESVSNGALGASKLERIKYPAHLTPNEIFGKASWIPGGYESVTWDTISPEKWRPHATNAALYKKDLMVFRTRYVDPIEGSVEKVVAREFDHTFPVLYADGRYGDSNRKKETVVEGITLQQYRNLVMESDFSTKVKHFSGAYFSSQPDSTTPRFSKLEFVGDLDSGIQAVVSGSVHVAPSVITKLEGIVRTTLGNSASGGWVVSRVVRVSIFVPQLFTELPPMAVVRTYSEDGTTDSASFSREHTTFTVVPITVTSGNRNNILDAEFTNRYQVGYSGLGWGVMWSYEYALERKAAFNQIPYGAHVDLIREASGRYILSMRPDAYDSSVSNILLYSTDGLFWDKIKYNETQPWSSQGADKYHRLPYANRITGNAHSLVHPEIGHYYGIGGRNFGANSRTNHNPTSLRDLEQGVASIVLTKLDYNRFIQKGTTTLVMNNNSNNPGFYGTVMSQYANAPHLFTPAIRMEPSYIGITSIEKELQFILPKDVPVLIDGRTGKMLEHIQPFTKTTVVQTFRVWATYHEGLFRYVCKTTTSEPVGVTGSLYLGTVLVNPDGSIVNNLEKATSFMGHRLSSVPSGNAIPRPANTGDAKLKWLY